MKLEQLKLIVKECIREMMKNDPTMLAANLESDEKKIDEMTTTGNVAGFQTPGWVSKKDFGSPGALRGSEKLGYTRVKNNNRNK